ncbi:MAG TPA: hypothetical protein VN783_01370, partial [Thermoanaerobaculia bacterium]|nr:hypothetical protein [Thermoanaerobaculia bacterium]
MPRSFALAPVALLAFLLLVPPPLAAQPPEVGTGEEPPEIGTDPGTSIDPSLPSEEWTLGDDFLPYDGDPLALDAPELYAENPSLIGTDPSFGVVPERAMTGCATETRTIVPAKIDPGFPRYLSYRLKTRLLVGVSADNGCHLDLSADKCNFANHRAALKAAHDAGLNKLRLWVSIAGEKTPNNVPFLYCAAGTTNPDCSS